MIIIKSLRVNQWIKNLVIFGPLISIGRFEFINVLNLLIVFFSFSLIVSSTYILNDIQDVDSDRKHPKKKYRPVASSSIKLKNWYTISIFLFLTGNFILLFYSPKVLFFSSAYYLLTLMYSYKLKYIKFLDIISISILFIIRVLIGGIAVDVSVSFFLNLFIFTLSLGLVTGKKLSILKNDLIVDTKVKNFLVEKYSYNFLKKLLKSSLIISLVVYGYWVFFIKLDFDNLIKLILLIFSIVALSMILRIFYKQSISFKTEEILEIIKTDKSFQLFCFLYFVTLILGLY